MLTDGQGTKCRRNIAENYNRLSRVHERYRQTNGQTTDRRQTDGQQRSLKSNRREQTSHQGAQFSGASGRVTVNILLRRRLQKSLYLYLPHYIYVKT